MRSLTKKLSNFSNALVTTAQCLRPENEAQVAQAFAQGQPPILARGSGSSYSDCCLNNDGIIIDTSRLNHLLAFDAATGILEAQAGVTFADLFSVHSEYVPPVIPGTLHATLAGGIANDIHGKNNHRAASLGQHIAWLELQLPNTSIHCSPENNSELFYATIGGLGLTGVIKRAAIKMRRASNDVIVQTKRYMDLNTLLQDMQTQGIQYDYQVAWLDLLNRPVCALLSLANHTKTSTVKEKSLQFRIPKLPFRCIHRWNMRLFNRYYRSVSVRKQVIQSLQHFNNPLDAIQNWNYLYGKQGLLQFQAVFGEDGAFDSLQQLLAIIQRYQATPTLTVLKYFTQKGLGLLSFAQPGFTIAIDFINNSAAKSAICMMNDFITRIHGKNYLAKDWLLTREQFCQQYPKHKQFHDLLLHYHSPMHSDLSNRLNLT